MTIQIISRENLHLAKKSSVLAMMERPNQNMTARSAHGQNRRQAVILTSNWSYPIVFTDSVRKAIEADWDVLPSFFDIRKDNNFDFSQFAEVDAVFASWGCPKFTDVRLAQMPNLKAVFYAAGTIRDLVTEAFWNRRIPICSSWALNAIPVAEFTFAQIILCLKKAYFVARAVRKNRNWTRGPYGNQMGAYGVTVGLVSFGQIARRVLARLKTLDVEVAVYDPFLSDAEAVQWGVRKLSLPELFAQSEVVSVHTPCLPETEGLITGELIASLPKGAAFINTARGAVIRENEMIAVLQQRLDIQAVLDVTYPEPPPPESPLYTLENVFLTSHIAGSMDRECERMGMAMVAESRRFLSGEPLEYAISKAQSLHMA